MTAKEQKEFWLKFHKFQMRYEIMYTPRINAVLKSQVQQYIKTKDTVYVRSNELYSVLMDLYKTTGAAWAYQTRGLLNKKAGGQMGFSERVISIMRQIFEFELLETAENITQTTIRLIQEVLSDAALEGWSFDEIVKKIVSPEMTAVRARLIARTETANAANAASMANLKAAGATKKIWIAARDNRTREHHKEVNQTVIGIDELFKVGDSYMSHPASKEGSAEEVCNCRCAVAGVVEDDLPLKMEDILIEQKRQLEPFMQTVKASVTNIQESINHEVKINSLNIAKFTNEIKSTISAPVYNVPAAIVNVEAPIVEVTENIIDQTEVLKNVKGVDEGITALSNLIITGQEKIIELLAESLKPKPKKEWLFTNVIEGGRIIRSTAKEK